MGRFPVSRLEQVFILVLLVVVALGAFRLKQQASVIEDYQQQLSEARSQPIPSEPFISLFLWEIFDRQANDPWLESLESTAWHTWITGRRDGSALGHRRASVSEALSHAKNPDLRIYYEIPFLANYLGSCIRAGRECVEIIEYLAETERVKNQEPGI